MPSIHSRPPAEKAGPVNVHTDHPGEPPELELFERLVDARHAHDFATARPLLAGLRRLGYLIVMVAPKPAGRRS